MCTTIYWYGRYRPGYNRICNRATGFYRTDGKFRRKFRRFYRNTFVFTRK
jgi:hypothetical protein